MKTQLHAYGIRLRTPDEGDEDSSERVRNRAELRSIAVARGRARQTRNTGFEDEFPD